MKLMNQRRKYNLQFFAADGDGDGSGSAGNDDGDDDQNNNDQDDKGKKSDGKKFFTQEELDEAIKTRLKREREKQKKQEQTKDDKEPGKGDDKTKDTNDKVSALEAKLLCFEHDVVKESVSDVVALARAYIDDDTDFEEAIEKVIKKYPQFVKGSSKRKGSDDENNDEEEDETDNQKGSWGQRQTGKSKKIDPVEEAFLKRNPGLKI